MADQFAEHLKFEQARLADLETFFSEEAEAAFDWFGPKPIGEVIPEQTAADLVALALDQPVTPEQADSIAAVALAAYARALEDETTIADLAGDTSVDGLVDVIVGMREVRAEIIQQVTTNEAYSELIAHVLYNGIKNYLVAEGGIASRVPGASSMMRLGRSAITSAAPGLEKGIDKQLTSFVNANISDSIRDSQTYLNQVLDEDYLRQVAGHIWQDNADTAVGDIARLIREDTITALIQWICQSWETARESDPVRQRIFSAISAWYAENGETPTADLLAAWGIDRELLSGAAGTVGQLFAESPAADYLATRVEGRLRDFYEK